MERSGFLTVNSLNAFFRAVVQKMPAWGYEDPVDVTDVVANEIFDMVQPAQPYKITMQDLLACGCGDTVISILIDVIGFIKYDQREILIHNNEGAD